MAMYKCVDCGRSISGEASVCPGCGKVDAGSAANDAYLASIEPSEENDKQVAFMLRSGLVGFILLTAIALVGMFTDEKSTNDTIGNIYGALVFGVMFGGIGGSCVGMILHGCFGERKPKD